MEVENGASAVELCGGAGKRSLAIKLRRIAEGNKRGLRTPARLPSDPFLAGGRRSGQVSARKLGARLWELQNSQMSLWRHHHELSEPRELSDFSLPSSSERAVTPICYFDLKRVLEDSEHSHETSTVAKILKRVQSLEEQYACSMSLIKALKVDLIHVRSCVQEVMKLQRASNHEMFDLRMQIVEDGLIRIKEEEDRTEAAVQSIHELKTEWKLRRCPENFHHKVIKELSELKSAFSMFMKDFDGQIKANNLLEEICDELARGVQAYEHELRNHRHHLSRKVAYSLDPSMLQISESWLEKRLQMRIAEEQRDLIERNKIMERLNVEIMTFLQARSIKCANVHAYHHENKGAFLHRYSIESLPLNQHVSATQDAAADDSLTSDFNCLDLIVDVNEAHEENPISQEPLKSSLLSLEGLGKVNNLLPLHYDLEQADKIAL